MRENKSGPNRWTTDQPEAAALPKFGEGLPPSRSAFEELRKYPFFFADDDDAESVNPPQARATHADIEQRSATAPPIPAPPTEIRPLLAYTPPSEVRAEVTNKVAEQSAETPAPAASASLAERHAAAIARKQYTPSAPPAPLAAPIERHATIEPAIDRETSAPAPRTPQAHPQAQGIAQEPWYSRVPTGVSLIAVIVYFLIGGVALIGTGLVLGGLGGGLMALFGLAVTAVAAFVAWQELTSTGR